MPDSWHGLGEYFSHEDKYGDPVEVGRDQAGGTYIATGRNDYRTVTYVTGVVPQLARALYGAEALEWPAHSGSECRAFYSPDPATQYRCTRAKSHQGPHLDDAQNTLWVSGWQAGDASGYRFIDARSDVDKLATGELPPATAADQCPVTVATGFGRVWCELARGHSGEHNANGYTWSPANSGSRDQPLCGVQLTWDQETEGTAQCVLPSGHTGLHGLGPNSGDYLSGRPVEEVVLELLRRVSSLEQVTGRHSASLLRVREPVPEDVRQTLRGIGRGITAIMGKLDRLGAEPVRWVTQIGEIADGVKALLETVQTPELCGVGSTAANARGDERCDQPAGHEGRHYMGITSWSREQASPPEPEIELTPDMLSEVADAMDQVMDAGGHVYDEPVRLQCDIYDWCTRDRGHSEDCSELR